MAVLTFFNYVWYAECCIEFYNAEYDERNEPCSPADMNVISHDIVEARLDKHHRCCEQKHDDTKLALTIEATQGDATGFGVLLKTCDSKNDCSNSECVGHERQSCDPQCCGQCHQRLSHHLYAS